MSQSSPDLPVESRPMPPAVESPPTPPANTPGGGVPLWLTMLISLICLGIGLTVSLITARKPEPPPIPVASVASSAEAKKAAPTQIELVEQGNPQAVDTLEKIAPAERSIEQALALSQGHAAEKRLALSHLRGTIAKLGGAPDAESTKRLIQFAKDTDTAREVIGLFTTLPGPLGPDLLYEFSTDKKTPPELAKLSEQLLLNKEVRPKASPALALLLDLRDATTCEARRPLLEKAPDVGDRRMLGLVISYTKKTGCGANNRVDCNPCLRDDNSKLLRTTIAKVQGRKPPAL